MTEKKQKLEMIVDDSKECKESLKLLDKHGVNYVIFHVNGKDDELKVTPKTQRIEGPLPWLRRAHGLDFCGLNGVKYYLKTYWGTELAY